MPEATIVSVDDAASCRVVVDLQAAVWGMPPHMVVPFEQTLTAAKWGGVVLLAYLDDEPVGFSYGFVGLDADGQPVLCSHMLGVLPAWQGRGIGQALKLRQRDVARERGLSRIVWTFDPLVARNAYLNLHKLGAVARRYDADLYGPMDDDLNRGLPSDRLLAEWFLDDRARSSHADVPLLNPPDAGGAPVPLDEPALEAAAVGIAIPADVGAVKDADADLALRWRHSVRAAFQAAFDRGFVAVDLARPGDGRLAVYVMERQP